MTSEDTEFEMQFRSGFTVEGLPFELALYFPKGSPAGTKAVKITGSYQSRDGGGKFDVEKEADLPWVVFDGVWE